MVAGSADHPDRIDRGSHRAGGKLGACAIHLYIILKMPKKDKAVETMLVLAMACLLAYVVWHWRAALYLSFCLGAIGIFSRYLSARIAWAWMGLARLLGRVTNTLLLSVVYFVVVVPVAVFRRMKGRDRLSRFDPKSTSNFVSRDHLFVKGDLEKTW